MKINLRKANALSKALLDEARKLPLHTVVAVSVYNTENFVQGVAQTGVKMRQNLQDAQALLAAGYVLRGLMGEAFQTSGISDLLTKKALADAREKLISRVLEKDHNFNSASDVTLAQPRLAALKEAVAAPTTRGYGITSDSLNVRVPDETFQGLEDELRAIRRQKADIADELLSLNTTTMIDVPAEVQELATRFKVA